MAKKVYAIKEGFDFAQNKKIENMIVDTWDECLKYVKGVKGAKYKSFQKLSDAKEYIEGGENLLKKDADNYPKDVPHFYVDGSYNIETKKYAYALVMVESGVVKYIENGGADNNSKKDVRQIAGELKASIKSIKYAAENNIKNIVLIHDYVGVCYHATGVWKRREESSEKYYNEFNKIVNDNHINVTFVKVDSHTGDLFNEIVDEFAKYACGVTIKGETKKYLRNDTLIVKNESLKEKFNEIVDDINMKNIIVSENV
ncbi:viroplasmin family protein [Clostridium massiliodielmoense]|uniref:ribonuclease H1 domain-containing protein n=1 Tax=Clostridium massiliodielmoense TaxID=1776385 RepID=UPI000166A06F|nr:ribonuclease H family protein [Clostridium massiliodielmoense]EDS77483.1 ribonuclease HI [Clostridium botulinum C str. Eklund]NEZ48055.1 ribonuclease HI [Clostridium botulinum]